MKINIWCKALSQPQSNAGSVDIDQYVARSFTNVGWFFSLILLWTIHDTSEIAVPTPPWPNRIWDYQGGRQAELMTGASNGVLARWGPLHAWITPHWSPNGSKQQCKTLQCPKMNYQERISLRVLKVDLGLRVRVLGYVFVVQNHQQIINIPRG